MAHPALFFAAVAIFCRARQSRFWLLVAALAMLHSLGENSAFYHASYHLIPGLRFFRGQERAALLVANSLAILAGLGIAAVADWSNQAHRKRALSYWLRFTALLVIIALGLFFAWSDDAARWGKLFDIAARSAIVAAASSYAVLRLFLRAPRRSSLQLALIALIAFELISVNIDQPANYDSVSYGEQISMAPPPYDPDRIGRRGFGDLFASMVSGACATIMAAFTRDGYARHQPALSQRTAGDHLPRLCQQPARLGIVRGEVHLQRVAVALAA